MMETKRTFHGLLQTARETADQSMEVMALMLNLSVEEYQALEEWSYPNDETLRRLCLINEWNYYDTQRLIINEMISPTRPIKPVDGEDQPEFAKAAAAIQGRTPTAAANINTLGERLRDVRMVTGQSIEIIAMLLGITPEEYLRMEEGHIPGDDLLRRISMIYNWNYQDLLSILRSQSASRFQPARVGMPFLGSSAQAARLKEVTREVEGLFLKISDKEQGVVLAQLELIRDTMRRTIPGNRGDANPARSPESNAGISRQNPVPASLSRSANSQPKQTSTPQPQPPVQGQRKVI